MDLENLTTEELLEMKKKLEGKKDIEDVDSTKLKQEESEPRRLDHIILTNEEIKELSQARREFEGKIYNPKPNDIDLIKNSINSLQNESTPNPKRINHIILTNEEIDELRRIK